VPVNKKKKKKYIKFFLQTVNFSNFWSPKPWIRIYIQPKMLDRESMNPDPKHLKTLQIQSSLSPSSRKYSTIFFTYKSLLLGPGHLARLALAFPLDHLAGGSLFLIPRLYRLASDQPGGFPFARCCLTLALGRLVGLFGGRAADPAFWSRFLSVPDCYVFFQGFARQRGLRL
jgi:hypothetical protein